MKELLKISGKKVALPEATRGWKFNLRPGGWIIGESPSGERVRFLVQESRQGGKVLLGANLQGRVWQAEVQADRRQAGGAGAGAPDAELTAQFPGKVRKILVSEGSSVKEGDALILVEAMKMEFSVKAPADARVSKILVREGQQLSPGDRFVELDFAPTNAASGGASDG